VARSAPGLEPDEELADLMTVAFRGSLAASTRGLALVSSRHRLRNFHAWEDSARAAGFPTDRPEMIVGVTAQRLVLWRPSFWFGRPRQVVGDVPMTRVANAEVYRQGFACVLALAFNDGQYIEIEAIRGRRLRRLRDAIRAQLPNK
jgi:hypothetical protein